MTLEVIMMVVSVTSVIGVIFMAVIAWKSRPVFKQWSEQKDALLCVEYPGSHRWVQIRNRHTDELLGVIKFPFKCHHLGIMDGCTKLHAIAADGSVKIYDLKIFIS